MNNYVKVVGTDDNRIEQTFFFDDTDEGSLRDVLSKAESVRGKSMHKTHLAMWRMPAICGGLLAVMRYTTPCPPGRHRLVTDESGAVIGTACAACGRSPD